MALKKKQIRLKSRFSIILLTCLAMFIVSIAYLNLDSNKVQAQSGTPVIFDNGGLATGTISNSGVTSPAGTQWSEAQNNTGNTTESNTLSGVSCSTTATVFRCADDFAVPTGQTWTINNVIVFAYQTGFAGGTSPITAGTLQIWDGVPGDPGSNILFGNDTTNVLGASTDTSLFRIFNSAVPPPGSTPGTTRRVWANTLNVSGGLVLTEGTYWVDWNTQIGTTTAHFAPPVTIPGSRGTVGMNARQRIAGNVWQDVIDAGNPASAPDFPQDFPFKIEGSIATGPAANGDTDFDGDGITDYAVVRDQTPALRGGGVNNNLKSFNQLFNKSATTNSLKGTISSDPSTKSNAMGDAPNNHGTNLVWYSANSGAGNSTFKVTGHGQPNDTLTPADFDGDGIDDIAVWRGVAPAGPMGAFFYVLNSSTSTVDAIDFGQMGDDARIVGDYDGDGKADPAVFRQATPPITISGNDLGAGTTFPGTGVGPIPDRGAVGCGLPAGPNLDISFAVTGMGTGAPSNVTVDMNATHTWVGDIDARLIAPDMTEHVLFSSTGSTTATGCGSADDLGGIYTFDNSGTDDWWAQPSPYPVGTYQTTSAGDVPGGGAATDMNAAFAGIPSMDGTWILRVNDSGGGDTGSISAANLILTGGAPPTGGPTTFFYKGSAGAGETTYVPFGDSSSGPIRPIRGDYDGDEKHDFVVYRAAPGAPLGISTQGQYVILRSSDSAVDYVTYGLTSDVIIPGDYDGDGKYDFMNSRTQGTQIHWYLLENDGGGTGAGSVQFGALIAGFDEFPATGDYDGDGKDDIAVYRRSNTDPDNCFFYIRRSSDGMLQTYEFGATTDFPVAAWDAQGGTP